MEEQRKYSRCSEDEPDLSRCSSSKKNWEVLPYLPDEVVTDILERLPVKSVLRFRCLGKQWSATLRSPTFIKNQHRKQGRMLLVSCCSPIQQVDGSYDDKLVFLDLESPEVETRPPLSTTFRKNQCVVQFTGCCNGIVCISYGLLRILCNPALHEFKPLPPINSGWPTTDLERRYLGICAQGFGITNDKVFKVIVMHRFYEGSKIAADLYNSRTNSWRRLNDAPRSQPRNHTIFLNGACHWLTHNRKTILSFDIEYEVFRPLELPDSLRRSDMLPIVLNNANGCLGLVQCQDWFSESSEPAVVWVMKEYGVKESWIKSFTLSTNMLMVSKCGLSESNNRHQLISISLHTNEMKSIPLDGVQSSEGVIAYAESLVTLDN